MARNIPADANGTTQGPTEEFICEWQFDGKVWLLVDGGGCQAGGCVEPNFTPAGPMKYWTACQPVAGG